MRVFLTKVNDLSRRYPVTRGMATYSVLWTSANVVQQKLFGDKDGKVDFAQVVRFGVFGTCWVAPTLYTWVRVAGRLWPQITVKTALYKAVVDQISYGPFAIATFYFGMTLLEGKSVQDAKTEVQAKFFTTWTTGMCIWPAVQFINFYFVPERNRVPFISVCSFLWSTFLSWMKHLEAQRFLLYKQKDSA